MSLKDDPIVLEFKAACKKTVLEISEYVGAGKCSSYDEYKLYAGKVRGLNIALELIDEVIETRITKDDIDDDE